ncbi:MAG: aminomethyl-transferring glycine dehydrogenase subunit GcvPB [bacterium]|nr:aminomethyl-transferring glycine dehydrogenase subunit GcvPB [bacterium]
MNLEAIRFLINASKKNYCIDSNFVPLGSCTMKYNRKILEKLVECRQYIKLHPLCGMPKAILDILLELEAFLKELTGFEAVSLWQQSGAHAEWVSMLMIRKYLSDRKVVLIPELAHGTNFASAIRAGFEVIHLKCNEGSIDIYDLKSKISSSVASIMLTYPNTLGVFEDNIIEVIDIAHKYGAIVYLDGANFNAFIGRFKPAEIGFDIMHLNLHKTFGTPHGSGGAGAGVICTNKKLSPYLPLPRLSNDDIENSIGYVTPFYGNVSTLIKAWAYIKLHGSSINKISELAVLKANYLKKLLENDFKVLTTKAAHEVVIEVEDAYSYAKALLDFGFYAPTINFPYKNVLMIEPTECESFQTIEKFVDALKKIKYSKVYLNNPPHSTPVKRVDEVFAARNLKLKDSSSI